MINRDLGSQELREHVGDKLAAFRRRELTGRDLLMHELDEKFFPSLLSSEAQAFTADYYETDQYVADYAELLATQLESVYHVTDSWDNYDTMARRLDERLAAWRSSRAV